MGAGAYLAAHEMTRNGKFKRGPIVVGAGCVVGPGARLTPHVTVEAGVNVPALACALPGQTFRFQSLDHISHADESSEESRAANDGELTPTDPAGKSSLSIGKVALYPKISNPTLS